MTIKRALLLTAAGALILINLWQHFQVIALGYDIQKAQKERDELSQLHQKLVLERETLSALDRVERIAVSQLGLTRPREGQVIRVEESAVDDPASDPAGKIRIVRRVP